MKWLRYVLDRIAARYAPHCLDDWMDCHENCERCTRIERRNVRLACYRRGLPKARVL